MRRVHTDYGFSEAVGNGVVERVECHFDTGVCAIVLADGSVVRTPAGCSIFNWQYGIPLSRDSRRVFVNIWEKGLFAYDVPSGELVWHLRERGLAKVFVYPDYLLAIKSGTAIFKIGVGDGKVAGQIRGGSIEDMFEVDDSCVFVSTIRGQCSIVGTATLAVTREYPVKLTNPSDCYSQMIRTVELRGASLVISGFEENPNRDMTKSGNITFERTIDYSPIG